jgi:hypothetical protein
MPIAEGCDRGAGGIVALTNSDESVDVELLRMLRQARRDQPEVFEEAIRRMKSAIYKK